ncbi:hypothetical protein D3C75_725060 [compost metagenome]
MPAVHLPDGFQQNLIGLWIQAAVVGGLQHRANFSVQLLSDLLRMKILAGFQIQHIG